MFIEKTPKSFIIYLPKLITKTLEEATRLKNQLAFEILDYLRDEFKGIKLGVLDKSNKIQELSHSISTHYGLPNDPLAQLCYNRKMTLRSERILIDNSPKNIELLKQIDPTVKGELETHDKTFGKEDIMTIWDEYHNIVNGGLSESRINSLQSQIVSERKDIEDINKEINDSTENLTVLSTNLKRITELSNNFSENVNQQMTDVGHLITGSVTMQQNLNNILSIMQQQLSEMQNQLIKLNERRSFKNKLLDLFR